eukprot:403341503
MDLSFKLQSAQSLKYQDQLTQLISLTRASKLSAAQALAQDLITLAEQNTDLNLKHYFQLKLAKVYFIQGEFLKAIKEVEQVVEKIEELNQSQIQVINGDEQDLKKEKDEDSKVDVQSDIQDQVEDKKVEEKDEKVSQSKDELVVESTSNIQEQEQKYMYLKAKWYQAFIHSKLKDFEKAEEFAKHISDQIRCLKTPENYWKFELKALYLRSRQIAGCMEFRAAISIIDKDAKVLLEKLSEHYYPKDHTEVKVEEGKEEEIQDSQQIKKVYQDRYHHEFRRQTVLYLKKFAYYDQAASQVIQLIKDQAELYKIELIKSEDENQLPHIDLSQLSEQDQQTKSTQLHTIAKSLFILSKIYAFQIKVKEVFEISDNLEEFYKTLYKTENHIEVFKICRVKKDSILKSHSVRTPHRLDQAKDLLDRCISILKVVLQCDEQTKTYYVATCCRDLGEIYLDKKQNDEAEKYILQSQRIIGEIFSDNHPIIIEFNANLIELYAIKESEAERIKCSQIAEKNLEISKQYYGFRSIYSLKQELGYCSNLINVLKFQESQQHVAEMRQIVTKFHNDQSDLMNQYLFLAQILAGMTLMSTEVATSAEKILNYVYQKQIEYCENDQEHPFLEQTLVNIGLFYRQCQRYQASLYYWNKLKAIQSKIFHHDREILVYTLKNIGLCYSQLDQFDKAEETFLEAVTIIEGLSSNPATMGSQETQKQDLEQLSSLYFSVYQASITLGHKERSLEYNLKALEVNKKLYGENSINVSNNHYIHAQLLLKLGKPVEAIEWQNKALATLEGLEQSLANNQEEAEKSKTKPADIFIIRLKYFYQLVNMYFIANDLQNSIAQINKALDYVKNNDNLTYSNLEDVFRIRQELRAIERKASAKLQNTTALDIKQAEQKPTETVVVQQLKMSSMLGVFGLFTSSSFLASYLLMKNKQ